MRRTASWFPVVLLLATLRPAGALAASEPVPPPPPAQAAPLAEDEARTVASRVLGCGIATAGREGPRYVFTCDGFTDSRRCPLDGIADVRCGDFAWAPARVTVFANAWNAAVSGHLARNRVVVVSLRSDQAAVSRNTLHGILVFPGTRVTAAPRPAFAWYLGRDSTPAGLDLRDVDRDGALDLVYAYEQPLGYTGPDDPVSVIPRDLWTVVDLKPTKPVSAGETVAATGRTVFDGVPTHEDGDEWARRGTWRWESLGPDLPLAAVLERTRLPGTRTGWDLHVVADFGEGWAEVLSGAAGAGTADRATDEPDTNCASTEAPMGVSVDARRRILDLEAACRDAVAATRAGPPRSPLEAFPRLLAAMRLREAGLPLVATALEDQAATDLLSAGPGTWPLAALLSLRSALAAHRAFDRSWSADLGPDPESWRDALALFPALQPLVAPLDAVLALAGKVG